MKKVLVTGATGFLGRHVVDILLEHRTGKTTRSTLRVLCRGKHPWKNSPQIEIYPGDILDPARVKEAVNGVDAVLHLAGMVKRRPDAATELFETHIEGTRNVCEAALANGNTQVVVASSSGTIAVSREPTIHDENSPYSVEIAGGWPYYLSKIYQEKLALSYHEHHDLPVVILNPSLLLGPGDVDGSSTNDIRLYLARRVANIPAGGLNFVDVRDAAQAFVTAIGAGKPGRRYLIAGHNMSVREFFFLLQWVSDVRAPLLSLPEVWARRTATAMRRGMALIGHEFPLDDMTIEMAYRFWFCSNERARTELAFDPLPAEKTVRDTVAYIRSRADTASAET